MSIVTTVDENGDTIPDCSKCIEDDCYSDLRCLPEDLDEVMGISDTLAEYDDMEEN